jgi:hypothetical protein
VQLTEEQYTIIAHIRFYVRDKGRPGAPAVKYDVAIGVSRVVERPVAAVSTDSWIMTCVGGVLLLLVISSTAYAAATGRINLDRIVQNFNT